jgi:hypothetical protein
LKELCSILARVKIRLVAVCVGALAVWISSLQGELREDDKHQWLLEHAIGNLQNKRFDSALKKPLAQSPDKIFQKWSSMALCAHGLSDHEWQQTQSARPVCNRTSHLSRRDLSL